MVVDPSHESRVPFQSEALPPATQIDRVGMIVQLHIDSISAQREPVSVTGCLAALCKSASAGSSAVTAETAQERFPSLVEDFQVATSRGVESSEYRTAARALVEAISDASKSAPTPRKTPSTLPTIKAPEHYQEDLDDEEPSTANSPNKAALVELVANYFDGAIDRRTANLITNGVLDSITELLCSHDEAKIKGFGTFVARDRKGRAYVHPLTGEEIQTPDKRKVLFFPSDKLNDKVRLAHEQRTATPKE